MAQRSGRFVLSARALQRSLGEWETGSGPAYQQLADRLRVLILDGRITAKTWLPAERELAALLGRSRSTVISAYASLRESGCLESVRGSGSRVILQHAEPGRRGFEPAGPIDLSKAAVPMWSGLPDLFREVAADFGAADAGSGLDLVGDTLLREKIADRYSHAGLATDPDQIMVTVGAQHAISLITGSLLSRGDRVLVETPTYPHAAEAFRDAGGRVKAVPVTADGWDVAAIADVLDRSRPAMAYVMPDAHNPTGMFMDAATRSAVLELATASGTILLIDETTRDLNIDGPQLLPHVATGDTSGLTITLGSMGKTVWHGLRIGWLRADPAIISQVATFRASRDLGTPRLDQLVAERVLDRMPEVIVARSERMRAGRDLVRQLITELLPEWRLPDTAGGVGYWVGLGRPASSQLALMARTHGVVISAGPRFGIDGEHERHFRMPFTADLDDIRAGISKLAVAWSVLGPIESAPVVEPDRVL